MLKSIPGPGFNLRWKTMECRVLGPVRSTTHEIATPYEAGARHLIYDLHVGNLASEIIRHDREATLISKGLFKKSPTVRARVARQPAVYAHALRKAARTE